MVKKIALYDIISDGNIVYVGLSARPKRRFSEHRYDKLIPFNSSMDVVAWFDGMDDALPAERRRIRDLNPPLNVAETIKRGRKKTNPVDVREVRHPGAVLEHDYLVPRDWSNRELARLAGVTPAAISRIVKGDVAVTSRSAIKLSLVLDTTARYWLKLQSEWELASIHPDIPWCAPLPKDQKEWEAEASLRANKKMFLSRDF